MALGVALLAGCPPPPDPVYDEDLDLTASATLPGELAGTFALYTRAIGPVDTPLGPAPSGNDDWLLVEREWDAAAQTYAQTTRLCGGSYFPVLETTTVIPTETWRLVPPSAEDVVVDHARGTFDVTGHLQLWALEDLEDPYQTPLPATHDEALDPAFLEHVFDFEEDGNLGATFFTEGIINAEVYAVMRKTTDLDGLVLSPDHRVGRSDHFFEFIVLETSVSLVNPEPQFNPTERADSWFEELRVAEGSDCDDVQALVDDGTLGERPF